MLLGQLAVAEKSNELTAIPVLLETLVLTGRIVTIDAMGYQHKIAARIVEQGGDEVLASKDNQPTLHDLVADHVAQPPASGEVPAARVQTVEKDHDRLETRTCVACEDPAVLRWLDPGGLDGIAQSGDGHGRAAHRRDHQPRKPLRSQQAARECGAHRDSGPWALGHREPAALGAGRGLSGR